MVGPLSKFDREFQLLCKYGARRRNDSAVVHPSVRAQSAITFIEETLEADIYSVSAIKNLQTELAESLAYVAHGIDLLSLDDYRGCDTPTRASIRGFVGNKIGTLVFSWIALPKQDRDAARQLFNAVICPMLREAVEMLRPLLHPRPTDAMCST